MEELNIPAGPKVGEILEKIFLEVTENGVPNERETLLNKLKMSKIYYYVSASKHDAVSKFIDSLEKLKKKSFFILSSTLKNMA